MALRWVHSCLLVLCIINVNFLIKIHIAWFCTNLISSHGRSHLSSVPSHLAWMSFYFEIQCSTISFKISISVNVLLYRLFQEKAWIGREVCVHFEDWTKAFSLSNHYGDLQCIVWGMKCLFCSQIFCGKNRLGLVDG